MENGAENRFSNALKNTNLHFKAFIELITKIYEPNTPQIDNYGEQFTDYKIVCCFKIYYSFRR